MPRRKPQNEGQALVEFTLMLLMVMVLLLGLMDFARFIYQREIVVNISDSGANLASRGMSLSNAVSAIITSAAPLNITSQGRVIITSVLNSNNTFSITGQVAMGALAATSHIGTGVGRTATLPSTTTPIPQPLQTLYVAEVFYSFTPVTPLGKLLSITMPSQIYDASYF